MALTLPHLHNPNTISEKFMISAVGITVAALAAVSVYQIGVTSYQPDATTTGASYLQATATPVETFSPELARVSAATDNAFSPELARVAESTTAASTTQAVAGPNPAEKSARGNTSAPNPAQASAIYGPD